MKLSYRDIIQSNFTVSNSVLQVLKRMSVFNDVEK